MSLFADKPVEKIVVLNDPPMMFSTVTPQISESLATLIEFSVARPVVVAVAALTAPVAVTFVKVGLATTPTV